MEKLMALKADSCWSLRGVGLGSKGPAAGGNVNILRHNWRVDLLHIKQRPQAA